MPSAPASPSHVSVGFVGTGIMGASMAGHLLAAGHPLQVFNRTRSKAEPLLARGAVWHDSPAAVAAASDVVVTMLGDPTDVEAVYFGSGVPGGHGLIDAARPGALLVDMTTSSPALAACIAAGAADRGLAALDAPVSGGDVGAKNASLVIMVGGEEEAFERARPLFALMGRSATLLGPAGAGQRCKLANQIAVAVGMVAWCEALAHARAGGLDPAAVQQVIAGGAAGSWALTNLAPRALADDVAPGFLVRHILKDIRLARQAATETGMEFPGLEVAERLYERLAAAGRADQGTQALWALYSGRSAPPGASQ
ncbi:MAG: NAD(P)-dependent oxidoreductase [Planctomycetia bacterium]|nr:NAD(P)-dependent oxidoreductase [Planctomycetia bacterium]